MKKKRKLFRGLVSFLWVKNPILLSGLSLVTAVMATRDALDALCISLATVIMLLPTAVCAFYTPARLRLEVRWILYTLVATVFYMPAMLVVRAIHPMAVIDLSIYLPLLAVNELIVVRVDRFVNKKSFWMMGHDILGSIIGFTGTMVIIAMIREFFAFGSLFGYKLVEMNNPVFTLPFVGLFIVAFAAAGLRSFQNVMLRTLQHRKHKRKQRAERLQLRKEEETV